MNFKIYFILNVICCLSFFSEVTCRNNSVKFEHLSTKQGLSHNRIFDIVKDSTGFMWFATLNGLNRFDGYNVKSFKHHLLDSTSISENFIEALFVDNESNLWVGTNFKGLNKYNPEYESFTRYDYNPDIPNSIADGSIHVINQLHDGQIIVGTNNGLSIFSSHEVNFKNYRNNKSDSLSLVNNEVNDILIAKDGTPWIGTSNGISVMNLKNNTFKNITQNSEDKSTLSDDYVLCLTQTSDHLIWIGTINGLNCYNTLTETFTQYIHHSGNKNSISNNYVHALQVDSLGDLWIGTINGITKIVNPGSDNEIYYQYNYNSANPNSLSGNKVSCFYLDQQDLMWMGTINHGVNKCYLGEYVFENVKHLATIFIVYRTALYGRYMKIEMEIYG